MSVPPQPPYAGNQPSYGAPYMGDHPEATKLLVLSIVSLFCCGPIAIYTFIHSNNLLQQPSSYSTSKIQTAKILSIVALALWIIGIIARIAMAFTGNDA